MMKPVIGITSGWDSGTLVEGWPLVYTPRHLISRLEQAGAVPVILPVVDDDGMYEDYIRMIDGLLVSGEVLSVRKNVFEAASGNLLKTSNPLRYANEESSIRHALNERIPLLSVCRGYQVLNVAAGGSMKPYDITEGNAIMHQQGGMMPPDEGAHEIAVKPGTKLHRILGTDRLPVNSFHRQAVDQVPQGYVASAFAPDGHVEAIEAVEPDRFVIGLQFHPERMEGPHWDRLFEQFVEAARRSKAGNTRA